MDPSVKECVLAHERDHVGRNKNCKDMDESGCRGDSPKDRDLGGGWFDIGNDIDECLAYRVGSNCLSAALDKYGCSMKDAPLFNGNPNKEKCRALYMALVGECSDGGNHCRAAGMRMPQCDRWKQF
jgi:hypothetical protein